MKPQVVAWELGKRLRNDAIVSCDSGTITTWWARHIPAQRGQMHSCLRKPRHHGLRAALHDRGADGLSGPAVHRVRRRRRILDADGGVRYRREVQAADQGRHHQEQHARDRSSGSRWCSWAIRSTAWICSRSTSRHLRTRAAGSGFSVEDPADCGRTIEEFLKAPGPAVLQATVDPFEPPMPAKVKAEQALHFAESLARGEPNRKKIVLTTIADRVRELI